MKIMLPMLWVLALIMSACTVEKPTPASETVVTEVRGGDPSISVAALRELLNTQSIEAIVVTTNKVKAMRPNEQLAPFLTAVWNGNVDSGVSSAVVANPRIRLEIADILLQMERNGVRGLDPKAYAEYARGLIGSKSTDIQRQALLVLAVANSPADVSTFSQIIYDNLDPNYRAAVVGLVGNCATDENLVMRMASEISKERADFLVSTWRQHQAFRKC
jgi:hypothetical protein